MLVSRTLEALGKLQDRQEVQARKTEAAASVRAVLRGLSPLTFRDGVSADDVAQKWADIAMRPDADRIEHCTGLHRPVRDGGLARYHRPRVCRSRHQGFGEVVSGPHREGAKPSGQRPRYARSGRYSL